MLLLGTLALLVVDYAQLIIPELYRMVIDGLEDGKSLNSKGVLVDFDMNFLLDEICSFLLAHLRIISFEDY